MSEPLATVHAASASGLLGHSTLCGIQPAAGVNLWLGEWFLVTCPDCLSLGTHEMEAKG